MIVAIHHPHYLPWLRYVDKIARSDVFVLLDDAQYSKNGWQNRNKIKCSQGWMYLTVPVLDAFGRPILAVRVDNQQRWQPKHWAALCANYARAQFFGQYREMFEEIYRRESKGLADLSIHVLKLLLAALGIQTPLVRSSDLGIPGKATQRLVDICTRLGATTYLSGDYAAQNHLDIAAFQARRIEVRLQEWQCREYRQQHMQATFIPDLSIVDLLFNEGERSLAVLQNCRREMALQLA